MNGYHHYGKIWFPEEEEVLECFHDFGNVFDVFAIDHSLVRRCYGWPFTSSKFKDLQVFVRSSC